ncbi:hypothetical protein ACIHFC_36350 [Streptomyces sp. NPDC052013]|uniref:hypothetical protein n=1 Tax=Streptomyces sp. NPDC052013 TaxID=3365679 RepID=UPI0037D14202
MATTSGLVEPALTAAAMAGLDRLGRKSPVQQQDLDQRSGARRVAVGLEDGDPERFMGGGDVPSAGAAASAVDPRMAPGLTSRISR